ncbi:MAG: hypothetical protein PsegKO_26660 [Pseudohongiellaceae bacterium]
MTREISPMRSLLNILLIVILVFPLNAGAAAWMAMSMDDVAHPEMAGYSHALQVMHSAELDGAAVAESSSPHGEHDSADCEEHCASCSNHCSSTAIISSHHNLFDKDEQRAGYLAGMTLYRHETLFRPPISA